MKRFFILIILVCMLGLIGSCKKDQTPDDTKDPDQIEQKDPDKVDDPVIENKDLNEYLFNYLYNNETEDTIGGIRFKIVIPEKNGDKTITSIAKEAFYGFDELIKITLPKSLVSIGNCAFDNCVNLSEIYIPNSVTTIGYNAFDRCNDLIIYCEAESKPETWHKNWNKANRPVYWGVNEDNFIQLDDIQYVVINDCATVTNYLGNKTDLIIPEEIKIKDKSYPVTSIGAFAFCECDSLVNLVLPDQITNIGMNAFDNCSNLVSINLPNGLLKIENESFMDCTNLKMITIPESVTYIGRYGFAYCANLTITCLLTTQPEAWDQNWNYSARPVNWLNN